MKARVQIIGDLGEILEEFDLEHFSYNQQATRNMAPAYYLGPSGELLCQTQSPPTITVELIGTKSSRVPFLSTPPGIKKNRWEEIADEDD